MATIVVLGAGMMGSAVCVPMVDQGHTVRLVGTHLDTAIIDRLKQDRLHPSLNFRLPQAIEPFQLHELATAVAGADAFGIGVSSAGVEWAGQALAPFVKTARPVLMISKGLKLVSAKTAGSARAPSASAANAQSSSERSQLSILPDVLKAAFGAAADPALEPVAVGGPCIAGELARREDTCVVLSGRDAAAAEWWSEQLRGSYYRVWTSTDVVGVEVSAALKNAYAMAMAFGAGVHEARGGQPGSLALHNYEAAVFAQATHEMQLVVAALGGVKSTATGLAGVGDLHVTCNGGRTGRFGRLLGLGIGVNAAIERMQGATLECLEILRVMREALPSLGAPRSLPLLEHMIDVALDNAKVAPPFDEFFRANGTA